MKEELHNLDILDASFPCSVFSIAGDRQKAWGKEKVFREGQKAQRLDDLACLINQTEKPVKLMEILIRNSTNVGDVVLDPFMGSGTTARACVNLDRKYIGFEIDQRQVDFANNELKNMSRQLSLF